VLDLTAIASFNHHIEVVEGIRAAECSAILRQFFKARRG
jgi:tRNA(Arg) A34 adenosine deaminase TadA